MVRPRGVARPQVNLARLTIVAVEHRLDLNRPGIVHAGRHFGVFLARRGVRALERRKSSSCLGRGIIELVAPSSGFGTHARSLRLRGRCGRRGIARPLEPAHHRDRSIRTPLRGSSIDVTSTLMRRTFSSPRISESASATRPSRACISGIFLDRLDLQLHVHRSPSGPLISTLCLTIEGSSASSVRTHWITADRVRLRLSVGDVLKTMGSLPCDKA